MEQIFKDHEFGFESGLHNDFDCSNGKEGAFVLYATFADTKKMTANLLKHEFWFNPDGPTNYQIPELNKEHFEENRVCCSCSDGCISEQCECKKELVDIFLNRIAKFYSFYLSIRVKTKKPLNRLQNHNSLGTIQVSTLISLMAGIKMDD